VAEQRWLTKYYWHNKNILSILVLVSNTSHARVWYRDYVNLWWGPGMVVRRLLL